MLELAAAAVVEGGAAVTLQEGLAAVPLLEGRVVVTRRVAGLQRPFHPSGWRRA